MTLTSFSLIALVFLIVGWLTGWRLAHICVATECEKLGGFYVYGKVFKCVEIEQTKGGKDDCDALKTQSVQEASGFNEYR